MKNPYAAKKRVRVSLIERKHWGRLFWGDLEGAQSFKSLLGEVERNRGRGPDHAVLFVGMSLSLEVFIGRVLGGHLLRVMFFLVAKIRYSQYYYCIKCVTPSTK